MHHLQRIGAASARRRAPRRSPSRHRWRRRPPHRPRGRAGRIGPRPSLQPTIRVFRTATGAVETVDFRTYVKNVLSREWISTWTTESLRSGALAVKNYGWYQVLHWRGYVNEDGKCFDVFDSTRDQHYDPTRPTYASMASAVDATWSTLRTGERTNLRDVLQRRCTERAVRRQRQRLADVPVGHPGVRPGRQDRRADPRHLLRRCRRHGRAAAIPAAAIADTEPNATAHAGTDGDARPVAGIDARRNADSDAHGDARPDPRTAADPGTAGTAGARWRPGRAGEATSPAPAESGADRRHRGRRRRIGHGVPDRPARDEAHARASAARHRHPRPGSEPVATGDGADRHWQALGRRVPGALPRWPARPVVSRPGRGAGW